MRSTDVPPSRNDLRRRELWTVAVYVREIEA